MDSAIDEMPSDWILKQFLVEHRSEVRSMWMTEYDEQAMWDDIREAYQEELEEKTAKVIASEKARADSLAELARSYGIPEEQIAAAEGRK